MSTALQSIEPPENLLGELLHHLNGPGAFTGHLAQQLNTHEQLVRSASVAGASVALGGFISSASSAERTRELLRLIGDGGFGSASYRQAEQILSSPGMSAELFYSGEKLLEHLFGAKLPQVQSAFAAATGLRMKAAATILQAVTPVVAGSLSHLVRARSLNGADVMRLLNQHRELVARLLPARLAVLGPLLGVGEIGTGAGGREERSVTLPVRRLVRLAGSIVLLMLALIALYLVRPRTDPLPREAGVAAPMVP